MLLSRKSDMKFIVRHVSEICVLSLLLVFLGIGIDSYIRTGTAPEWLVFCAGGAIGTAVSFKYKKNGEEK